MENETEIILTYGPELEELYKALWQLGFVDENWPAKIDKPDHIYMLNNRTGLRARLKYNSAHCRWEVSLI